MSVEELQRDLDEVKRERIETEKENKLKEDINRERKLLREAKRGAPSKTWSNIRDMMSNFSDVVLRKK